MHTHERCQMLLWLLRAFKVTYARHCWPRKRHFSEHTCILGMIVAMKIFALYNRRYSYIQTFAYFLEPTQINRLEKLKLKRKTLA